MGNSSDTVYWQVADQPGKEGPGCLFKGDSGKKEVNMVCHLGKESREEM